MNEVSIVRKIWKLLFKVRTAALDMAKLNLSYTVVAAPCDGKLGVVHWKKDNILTAGQTITYIVPNTQKWVIANYKETQVENLTVGQDVEIR